MARHRADGEPDQGPHTPGGKHALDKPDLMDHMVEHDLVEPKD